MRLGIFGGSFDPVHNAHVALARTALAELKLDELIWVPAGRPWQKKRHLTPAADREAMVRLAIAGEPRFVLSRIELERSGPSYTIDTVRALRRERPDAQWYLVIGQDQYAGFHTWHGWQELLSSVTLAIIPTSSTPAAFDFDQATTIDFDGASAGHQTIAIAAFNPAAYTLTPPPGADFVDVYVHGTPSGFRNCTVSTAPSGSGTRYTASCASEAPLQANGFDRYPH